MPRRNGKHDVGLACGDSNKGIGNTEAGVERNRSLTLLMEKVAPRHRGMAWRLYPLPYALHNQAEYLFTKLGDAQDDGSGVSR